MSTSTAAGGHDSETAFRTFGTAASAGIVAMVLADMVHEGLGHGTACLLTGNRIVSLSTVAIQTAAASRFVSAAGTTANLIAGALSLLLFGRLKRLMPSFWFLWLFGMFNLLNVGYLAVSAVTNSGDWANVIAGSHPLWLWRCLMGLTGAALYMLSVQWGAWLTIRRVENGEAGRKDLPRATAAAYLAAGAVMTLASVFNPVSPRLIVLSGIGASFGLNAGLLFIPGIVNGRARTHLSAAKPLRLSLIWIPLALLFGGVFVAVLGPGIHFHHS